MFDYLVLLFGGRKQAREKITKKPNQTKKNKKGKLMRESGRAGGPVSRHGHYEFKTSLTKRATYKATEKPFLKKRKKKKAGWRVNKMSCVGCCV